MTPAQPELEAPSNAHAPTPASERVPLGAVLSWGVPVFALSAGLFFVQFFFLKFATDVLLLAPLAVSVLFALGRVWDAISDPIAGTWSDRTRTRFGRRRPWMLVGIPLLVVSLLITWIPPRSLEGAMLIAWVGFGLFLFYTAFTVYMVPHLALGSELSTDHHDRSRIFGVQSASFTLGMLLAFGGMQYVMTADDPRDATTRLVTGAVLLLAVVLLLPPILIRERPEYQGRGSNQPLRAMRDVLQNRHARRLLFAQFVQMLGAGAVGILSPYQVEYILKRPDLIGPLPALFVLCSVGSIPVWVLLSRRYGKRSVWVVAMIGAGLAFGSSFFVGEGDVLLISMILPVAGASLGCGGVVGPSILADVIDDDELKTRERKEGAYNAAWGFALKISNALVIIIAGLVLQLAGFVPNVEQNETTKLALRLLYAMPLVFFLAAAAVISGLELDEAEHTRIRAALDARARDG